MQNCALWFCSLDLTSNTYCSWVFSSFFSSTKIFNSFSITVLKTGFVYNLYHCLTECVANPDRLHSGDVTLSQHRHHDRRSPQLQKQDWNWKNWNLSFKNLFSKLPHTALPSQTHWQKHTQMPPHTYSYTQDSRHSYCPHTGTHTDRGAHMN